MSAETIPVISLWEPWASAVVATHPDSMFRIGNILDNLAKGNTPYQIFYPVKENETRSWSTKVRGWVLIHASLKWDGKLKKIGSSWPFDKYKEQLQISEDRFGHIIGAVYLYDCISSEKWKYENFPTTDEHILEQAMMGDFTDGRFIFKLKDPIRFDVPIKIKGKQTPFWKLPLSELPKKYQIAINPANRYLEIPKITK